MVLWVATQWYAPEAQPGGQQKRAHSDSSTESKVEPQESLE